MPLLCLLAHPHPSLSVGRLYSHISLQLHTSISPSNSHCIAFRPAVLAASCLNSGSARKNGSEAARCEARGEEGLMNEGSRRVGTGIGAWDTRTDARVGLGFRGMDEHGAFSYIAPLRPRSFSTDAAFSSYDGLTLPLPHCAGLHASAFIFTEYL
ncbi:uncharacterized protein SCHCODRAFT_02129416 [Schizophyllum commune H4-8]|uniref:uncharacterized protein n=1 Tax=Schizophyllum commune (strain H4-8 / FGSC 9210) TaxID=578458 RepID=UPI00215FAC25|nr:uncharacterized protein SCHCODRAFT_02129416 [Schizophyllum commune H4-8]KAI5885025.1 hypothetical protein SCHCODRAFT_02129416 [Schizophyllum commune H4-8]